MHASFSDLECDAKKRLTRRDRFLAEIGAVTPRTLLVSELEPYYPKGEGRGRPPIGLEKMLRMYIAQQCFGFSDEAIGDTLYIRWLLRMIRRKGISLFLFFKALGLATYLRVNQSSATIKPLSALRNQTERAFA